MLQLPVRSVREEMKVLRCHFIELGRAKGFTSARSRRLRPPSCSSTSVLAFRRRAFAVMRGWCAWPAVQEWICSACMLLR